VVYGNWSVPTTTTGRYLVDIYAELAQILVDFGIDRGSVTTEARFRTDLDVDSTDLVAIGMAVEKRMPFPVDTTPFPALESVAEMVALIEEAYQSAVPEPR
jgi:acyl carrier protein